jgi:hypothetical protein
MVGINSTLSKKNLKAEHAFDSLLCDTNSLLTIKFTGLNAN